MLTSLETFRGKLTRALAPGDEAVWLDARAARFLDNVGIGNHTYLLLEAPTGIMEVVRYDHGENFDTRIGNAKLQVPVQRDVTGTGRYAFACGTCVRFVWTSAGIREFVQQSFPELGGE